MRASAAWSACSTPEAAPSVPSRICHALARHRFVSTSALTVSCHFVIHHLGLPLDRDQAAASDPASRCLRRHDDRRARRPRVPRGHRSVADGLLRISDHLDCGAAAGEGVEVIQQAPVDVQACARIVSSGSPTAIAAGWKMRSRPIVPVVVDPFPNRSSSSSGLATDTKRCPFAGEPGEQSGPAGSRGRPSSRGKAERARTTLTIARASRPRAEAHPLRRPRRRW